MVDIIICPRLFLISASVSSLETIVNSPICSSISFEGENQSHLFGSPVFLLVIDGLPIKLADISG